MNVFNLLDQEMSADQTIGELMYSLLDNDNLVHNVILNILGLTSDDTSTIAKRITIRSIFTKLHTVFKLSCNANTINTTLNNTLFSEFYDGFVNDYIRYFKDAKRMILSTVYQNTAQAERVNKYLTEYNRSPEDCDTVLITWNVLHILFIPISNKVSADKYKSILKEFEEEYMKFIVIRRLIRRKLQLHKTNR